MPGTLASERVMVGLGQDYYVERTPQEAQAVLRRRISGEERALLFLIDRDQSWDHLASAKVGGVGKCRMSRPTSTPLRHPRHYSVLRSWGSRSVRRRTACENHMHLWECKHTSMLLACLGRKSVWCFVHMHVPCLTHLCYAM